MLPVAILSGGLATRLRPLTEHIPKSLVEVNGRPFIYHQLELLRANGISQVILCLGYLGEMIDAEIGDGSRLGLQISYSYDGEILRGTGGALRNALPLLGEEFFVLYGDSYLPIDYLAVENAWRNCNHEGLMTVFRNEDKWDSSNVCFENGEVKIYDKKQHLPSMHHIDYGISVLAAKALKEYPADAKFDLAEVFTSLVKKEELAAFEVHQRFYEIGSHTGIEELNFYLSQKTNPQISE